MAGLLVVKSTMPWPMIKSVVTWPTRDEEHNALALQRD